MRDKLWGLFVGFLFSGPGIALCVALGTSAMVVITYLTKALASFAPLSYGVVAVLSIAVFLCIFFAAANITKQVRTHKPTFIEIDVSNATLGVLRTSNIEDQRSFNLQQTIVYLFIFKRPVAPGHIIHIDGLRNSIPKIEKQYVTSKAACIFLTGIAPECAFRLTFNKSLEV